MPFYTRDFKALFGLEHTTIQYLLQNNFIQMTGPPPRGRGSRRSYNLDAAYRIGLIALLRHTGMEIPASYKYVVTIDSFIKTMTNYDGPVVDDPLIKGISGFDPFHKLFSDSNTILLLDIIDYTWATIHIGNKKANIIQNNPYFYAMAPDPDREIAVGDKTTFPEIQFAKIRIQLDLTAIALELTEFIKARPKQFPEHQYDI